MVITYLGNAAMNSYIKVPLQPDDVEYESDFWGTGDGFKPAKPQIKKIIRYQTDVALEEQVGSPYTHTHTRTLAFN